MAADGIQLTGLQDGGMGHQGKAPCRQAGRRSRRFIKAYFAGLAHKPHTTCGTVNAAVCERFIAGFRSPNAVDLIAASPFPDSG